MDSEDVEWRLRVWVLKVSLAFRTLGVLVAIAAFCFGVYAFSTGRESYFGVDVPATNLAGLHLAPSAVVVLGSVFVMVGGVALALKWT